ncbi:pantetheine-phosphate adenylyltransferase [bacterium]|nr:pantetheine-phosphate adenylyltransferase [bacterium]
MKTSAVYAGSFDPLTSGHLDILKRVCPLFEKVYVMIAENSEKTCLFSAQERVSLVEQVVASALPNSNVEVSASSDLTVNFCKEKEAKVLVRGLRAMSDFEKELQMSAMNKHLCPEVETLHIMTDERYFYVSSSLVKEIAKHGGNISGIVPPEIENQLIKKFKEK